MQEFRKRPLLDQADQFVLARFPEDDPMMLAQLIYARILIEQLAAEIRRCEGVDPAI